jgi:ABC-2 type transport system permease protein
VPTLSPSLLLSETLAVARINLLTQGRFRMGLLGTMVNPFFLFAPLLFLAQSFVGPDGRYRRPFVELTGYENHLGYLVVPLVGATLAHTVFSAVGQTIRHEQIGGTLERTLVSLRYPIALILGRSLGYLPVFGLYVASAVVACLAFFDLGLRVDALSALVLLALHLALVFGVGFFLACLFLWVDDPTFLQQFFSRFVLLTLTGATYPLVLLPGWLQVVARAIPFTWAYELERRAWLRAEPLPALFPDLAILAAMTAAVWLGSIVFFRRMLRRAKRTGQLGHY